MRVILDTNVLVSAVISAHGPPGELLAQWRQGRFDLLTCDEQIDEIRRVTRTSKVRVRVTPAFFGTLVNELNSIAILIDRMGHVDLSPDPFDNFLLALAEAGQADFLVTGDKAGLLELGRFGRTQIITARGFLDRP